MLASMWEKISPLPSDDISDVEKRLQIHENEKLLNRRVRFVASMEWVANAIGMLATLWASVVVLGDFGSKLKVEDKWFAVVMVFIEPIRLYCRDTKSEWLFGTMEAIRWKGSHFVGRMLEKPHEWNEVVVTICFCVFLEDFLVGLSEITSVVLIAWMIKLQCAAPQQLMMNRRLVRAVLIANIFFDALEVIWQLFFDQEEEYADYSRVMLIYTVTLDIVLMRILPIMAALLLYLRPSGIINGTNSPLGRKWLSVAKTVSAVWFACNVPFDWELVPYVGLFRGPVALVVLCLGSLQTPTNGHTPLGRIIDTVLHISCLLELGLPVFPLYRAMAAIVLAGVLVFDNLQIPTAIVQVVFSSWKIWMPPNKQPADQQQQLGTGIILYGLEPNTTNNSINYSSILYALTLCQGLLYIVACITAQSSNFIRRQLVRQSGLSGEQDVRAVYLYYQHVYTTCKQTGVLSGGDNNLSLASFAIHSLSSNSRELQLAGVFVLDCFLRRNIGGEELVSAITSDSTAVSTLIRMLACTAVQDTDTRLLAARVTAELAATGSLNMASTPNMLKSVSSLLDAADQPALQGCPLTKVHGPENENDDSGNNVVASNDPLPPDDGIVQEDAGDNQSPGQESSAGSSSSSGSNSAGDLPMHGECSRGVLQELPLTYKDYSFPVLGMTILNSLANDHDRCVEIGMATNLISKIVGFVSSTTVTANTADTEQLEDLVCLCLNLVRKLASTSEKIGAKLRQQLWENPYLLYKLAGILKSKPEKLWEPAIDIIAKLAWDEEARQEIGSAQEIISKLIHAFLGRQEGTNMYYDQPLRMAAGEALANLTISSTTNCRAILDEPGRDIIKDLKDMFFDIEYRYIAANLLQNLCAHCREEMCSSPSSSEHLSSILQEVMETIIISTKGKMLEVLIGLASQVLLVQCNIFPKSNVQGMHQSHIDKIADKMVCALHENMIPNPEYPRIRRVTIEMAICLMQSCPLCVTTLREKGMIDALSKITPSKVEKHRIFYGNVGVVLESGVPLPELVAQAKKQLEE